VNDSLKERRRGLLVNNKYMYYQIIETDGDGQDGFPAKRWLVSENTQQQPAEKQPPYPAIIVQI
jgi:hypothetical protein